MKAISLFFFVLVSCAMEPPGNSESKLRYNLHQCFTESDSYHGKNSSIKGSMTAELVVDVNNKVQECAITASDFFDPNLKTCVCTQYKNFEMKNTSGKEMKVTKTVDFKR